MIIEPQMYIPSDAKAEASDPLSIPLNTDKRMAGIDETDKSMPAVQRSRVTGLQPPDARARRIQLLLQELQSLHTARDSSPKDNLSQQARLQTADRYDGQNPLGIYSGGR